jgi:hypothetical protein
MCEIPRQNPLEQLISTQNMKDRKVKQVLSRGRYQYVCMGRLKIKVE